MDSHGVKSRVKSRKTTRIYPPINGRQRRQDMHYFGGGSVPGSRRNGMQKRMISISINADLLKIEEASWYYYPGADKLWRAASTMVYACHRRACAGPALKLLSAATAVPALAHYSVLEYITAIRQGAGGSQYFILWLQFIMFQSS